MRTVLFAIILGVLMGLGACATTDQPKDPDQVTSIPWNRPQPWEGRGPFGGFSPGVGY
jgi:hypothetical protein